MTGPAGRQARHRGSRRRPPRRRAPRASLTSLVPWVREHVLLAALVPAVIVVAAVAIVVVTSLGGKPAHTSHSSTASVQSAVAVTKGDRWVAGSAGKLLTAVNTDIGKLSAAQRAGQQAAAKAAGARLASAARTALAGPMPPEAARLYRSALNDLESAGTMSTSGNFSKAGPLLNAGQAKITKVTALVNRTAPVAAPGVVEPNE